MSLLMQALKKAERAKQNSVHEIELDKPSEAYDEVLSLTPVDAAPVSTIAELSLSPLTEIRPNTGEAPQTVSAGAPAQDFAPRPSRPAESAREAPRPDYSRAKAEPKPKPRPGVKPGAKTAPRKPLMVEPGTIRLAGLCAILLLTLGGGGFWFWKATTAPGAGADLPMVPMPPPLAAGTIVAPAATASVPIEEKADGTVLWRDPSGEAAAPQLVQQQAPQAPPQAAMQQPTQQQAQQQAQQPRQPESLPPVVAADNTQIKVLRSNVAPRVNPTLQNAYQAFSAGDSASARHQYEAVASQDPNNRDALLGLAAVAVRDNQGPAAASYYLRLLELDPNDADALAGLIGVRQGDPAQSEARLKAILQRGPEAGPVLFALGNLYAKQARWQEAQQMFFRAFGATPENADYAFNLAVGLDRLNQGKLALSYYQRALALAQNNPGDFSRDAVHKRMRELSAAVARPAPAQIPAAAAPAHTE